MIKKCKGCPFNDGLTEEASYAQDMGCLPDASTTIKWFSETGKRWACHSKPTEMCAGLLQHCMETKKTVDFSTELITEQTTIEEIYKDYNEL